MESVSNQLLSLLDKSKLLSVESQVEVSRRLGVSPAALSKQLSAIKRGESPPEDRWICGIARLLKLDGHVLESLLLSASIERSSSDRDQRDAWKRIRDRYNRSQPTVSQSALIGPLVKDYLAEQGVQLPYETVNRIVGDRLRNLFVGQLSFSDAHDLRKAIVTELHEARRSAKVPTLGEIVDGVSRLMRVRAIRPRVQFAGVPVEHSANAAPERTKFLWMPLVPGVLLYDITMKPGGALGEHHDNGVEFVIAVTGNVTMTFHSDGEPKSHVLSGAEHDMVLYDANVPHSCFSAEGAHLLVALYSPRFVRKWEKLLSIYAHKWDSEHRARRDESDGQSGSNIGADRQQAVAGSGDGVECEDA